jgi:conjugal transfer mating pair stabilization protein TraN
MYEDGNYKIQIDWKSLILKFVLIVIAILLIVWLFPMPKLDTFYNRVFNDNLATMKEAAENYFTTDNLPVSNGASSTLKLQDMLDKKLIVSFVDKNNNACNTSNSYAQVTKTENNTYVLKVQLSCDDKTDYVLENINTSTANTKATSDTSSTSNNTSSNSSSSSSSNSSDSSSTSGYTQTKNNSEDDAEDTIDANASYDKDGNKISYQYKKAITKTSTSYTCPDGYAKENNICYKYETGETINATPLYFDDVKTTTDAKKNTTGEYMVTANPNKTVAKTEKVCPDGYTLNNNICYKYDSVHVTPGSTTYTCPDGYTLNGTTCTKTQSANYVNNSSTYYTCPAGYSLNGTTCYRTNTSTSYTTNCTCPSGYTASGNSCVKSVPTTTYTQSCSCPSGYSASGSSCAKAVTSSYAASKSSYWSNPTSQTSTSPLSTYNNGSSKRVLANHVCTARGCTYTYYTYTLITNYSCPNGGTRSGSTCYTSSYTYANKVCSNVPHTTYTTSTVSKNCTSTPNTSTSTDTVSATPNTSGSGYYSCPAGYSVNGSSCTQTVSATPHTSDTEYSCPSGYVKDGSTCYQYTEPTTKTTYNYTCPDGYTQSGSDDKTTCTKKIASTTTYYCDDANATLVDDKCVKTVKGALKGYSCPDGYVLNTDKCVKKTTTCMKAEEVTNTSTSYEYKWSTESSLEGWTQTGKTKTISNNYDK